MPEEEIKVEQMFRIGEKDKTNRARLLKIKVENMEIKKKILINSKCLNEGTGITDPKKKIYINLDYTKKERDINRTLREEPKAMPTEKREKHTIKYNRIVLKDGSNTSKWLFNDIDNNKNIVFSKSDDVLSALDSNSSVSDEIRKEVFNDENCLLEDRLETEKNGSRGLRLLFYSSSSTKV